MRLDKTILSKLEQSNLIVKEKSGRNVFVSLTESGKYLVCLSRLPEQPLSRKTRAHFSQKSPPGHST